MVAIRLAYVLGCVFLVGACKRTTDTSGGTAAATATWYHARLVFKGVGDLPFFIQIPAQGHDGPAYVLNGDEKEEFAATWRGQELVLTGNWNYTSVIEAEIHPDTKALEGTWTRETPLWGTMEYPFTAMPIAAPDPRERFPGSAPVEFSIAGTWRFLFDQHAEGKGSFQQNSDGVVRGYIKPGELGDIRFLAGNLSGDRLSLSHFNGNAAYLVLAQLSDDGQSMTGLVSVQNMWNERFSASKVDDFDLVSKVRIKEGATSVSLRHLENYRGKPVLAVIFATWCSSCNDAMPYLVDLYRTYHPRGLEILSVAYDLSNDVAENERQLELFRAKYKVPWELVQVPCEPETWVANMPPELEGWDGLPIMLLVNPDGTVKTVFGGWFGPATGADGERRRKWFEEAVDALVNGAGSPRGT
jgi:thiol-disulfide isomerase/thioredoxin